jgi:hypothetical protein
VSHQERSTECPYIRVAADSTVRIVLLSLPAASRLLPRRSVNPRVGGTVHDVPVGTESCGVLDEVPAIAAVGTTSPHRGHPRGSNALSCPAGIGPCRA